MTVAFSLSGLGLGRAAGELFFSPTHRPAMAKNLALLGACAGTLLVPAAAAPAGSFYILALSAYLVEHHLAPHLESRLPTSEVADLTLMLHVALPVLAGSMCLWLSAD